MNQYLAVMVYSIAIYLFIIVAIRLTGKKELSQLSVIDLVFILLISSAVQNAMVSGTKEELFKGFASAGALFILNFILKQVLYRNKRFSEIVKGTSVMLVHDGKVLTQNLEHEKISLEELRTAAREHGVGSIEDINLAVLETDGSISILSNNYHLKTRKRRPSRSMTNSNDQ